MTGRTKVLAASHGLNAILGVVSIRDDRRFKQTVEAVDRLVLDTVFVTFGMQSTGLSSTLHSAWDPSIAQLMFSLLGFYQKFAASCDSLIGVEYAKGRASHSM